MTRYEHCVRCAAIRGRRQLVPADDGLGPGWRHRSERGIFLRLLRSASDPEQLGGFIFWHRRAHSPSGLCGGAVPVVSIEGRPAWTLVSLEPLTLSPSIHCLTPYDGRICGVHGFVTDGKWVAA